MLWTKGMLIICLTFIPSNYWTKDWQGNWENRASIQKTDAFSMPKYDFNTIIVNIPNKKLYFKDKVYPISVGKFEKQTPIGMGSVIEKREKIHFTYTKGVRKGQTIEYFHDLKGNLFKMPYEKMRGLGLKIDGLTDYVIHSTTEDWNLEKDVSSGCLRLRIADMLELYKMVRLKTPIVIDYILCEVQKDFLYVYKDIYRLNHCIFDKKKIDFISYAYQEVKAKTGRRLMIDKFITVLKKKNFHNDTIKIPLREIIE